MSELKADLSKKDQQFRDFSLNGNMWVVVLRMCLPLALYQSLNQLFKILDSIMAAHISSESVSAIAYLSQINLMLSAIGGGLAIGASLKISEAYGAGNYILVKKRVSSLYTLCAILGILILITILPFTEQFLHMANTPQRLITVGKQYFIIELISMVIMFFNNVYIAIERARGNSKRILYLNFVVIAIKLSLTAIFVYILNTSITMIAGATLISQIFLFLFAIGNIRGKDNLFAFSTKAIILKGNVVKPMLSQSFPVIIEKISFSFGKVVINAMSTIYDDLTVGALGVSNNIGGITTAPQGGFQEGGAAIISQNLGAGKRERAIDAFKKILIANILIGIVGFSFTLFYLDFISHIFSNNDIIFQQLIISIYSYEAFGAIMLGINSAVMALLYGLGKPVLTLFLNFTRVFIFRVPVLWFLQHFTNLGSESVGIVMMISNVATGLVSAIIAYFVIKKFKRETEYVMQKQKLS